MSFLSHFAYRRTLFGVGIKFRKDVGALNYSLDFVGGTATTVTFDKENIEEVDSQMV